MKKLLCVALGLVLAGQAAADVNVYSKRQEFLIKPMLDKFTQETGIKVNTTYMKKGLETKLQQEGKDTPADVILTVGVGALENLVKMDLVAPISSKAIDENIPANLRNEKWIGLTNRARVVYSSKERVGKLPADFDYLDLAKPEWKGKICTRKGDNGYNLALFASIIAHHGEAKAKEFLQGLKANLARKPQGNDRAQVKAIKEGVCDLAVGNSYYFGKMVFNEKEPVQKTWADAVFINFPGQKANGTHVNISGAALSKYSKNKEDAMKLIDFLTSEEAQQMYAKGNYEHPVKPGVEPSEFVKSWGEFKPDTINPAEYAPFIKTAAKLVDEVKYNEE